MIRTIILLLIPIISTAQYEEIMDALKKRNTDYALKLAEGIYSKDSSSYDINFILARAHIQKKNYSKATYYLENANSKANKTHEIAWVLTESVSAYFGLGDHQKSREFYNKAIKKEGTIHSKNELKALGLLFGFDELYKNWEVKETDPIIFYFSPSIKEDRRDYIISSRQKAYHYIQSFFGSTLPQKIHFFVWDDTDNPQSILRRNLGFTKPEFCVSHVLESQSPGHEICHSISYWYNGSTEKKNNKFLDEGIAVCFDYQNDDKIKRAKNSYKMNPVDIRKLWTAEIKISDEILYPIAGGFVKFLIEKDKSLFLKLINNQTYEHAAIIYGQKIEEYIEEFEKKMKEE